MPKIPTSVHAAGDLATGALLLAAPRLLPLRDRRAQALAAGAGAGTLALSAFTDYELGIRKRIPMPVHLLIDAVAGGLLVAGGLGLRGQRGVKLPDWLPHVAIGAGEIAAAGLTKRGPVRSGPGAVGAASATPSPSPAAARSNIAPAAEAPPAAPPPIETPGPSVTPPADPESDAERRERFLTGDEVLTGGRFAGVGQRVLESFAAAEAAGIGGRVPHDAEDPAMEPVLQAGGGEQDGWEAAEAQLIENATHGEGRGNPERDAFTPEAESDRASVVYGEADSEPVTEVVEDPEAEAGDPGAGPGIAADR